MILLRGSKCHRSPHEEPFEGLPQECSNGCNPDSTPKAENREKGILLSLSGYRDLASFPPASIIWVGKLLCGTLARKRLQAPAQPTRSTLGRDTDIPEWRQILGKLGGNPLCASSMATHIQ
ncbi:hypothetical protein E2C01_037674 [Portunus trituberculatus]|uniref:Uncharacterized protein n=1 Tax=Portunus trituberculatus TaxID=210409 RepID=A0A5B7FEN4_PORTR|nr:hypothetical protein [Portunus trituberculatus]